MFKSSLSPPITQTKEFMNHQTKYWAFTWEPNCNQKKIPRESELIHFLNEIGTEGVFQLERGAEKGKLHYQGVITLEGPRISKKKLLNTFRERFRGKINNQ